MLPLVYMIWVDSHSQVKKGVTVEICRIKPVLSADVLVLLASAQQGLQHALNRFSAVCDRAGMKISTKKTGILSLKKPKAVYTASERQCNVAGGEDEVSWGGMNKLQKAEGGHWRYMDQ